MADDRSLQPQDGDGTRERETADQRLGLNVRTLRELKGLSQRAIAEKMRQRGHSWHQQTVLKAEAGTRPVRFAEAVDLAAILHTSLDRLTWAPAEARAADLLHMRGRQVRASGEAAALAVQQLLAALHAAREAAEQAAGDQRANVAHARGDVMDAISEWNLEDAVATGVGRYEEFTGGRSEEASD